MRIYFLLLTVIVAATIEAVTARGKCVLQLLFLLGHYLLIEINSNFKKFITINSSSNNLHQRPSTRRHSMATYPKSQIALIYSHKPLALVYSRMVNSFIYLFKTSFNIY
jgi:hypothetical protein